MTLFDSTFGSAYAPPDHNRCVVYVVTGETRHLPENDDQLLTAPAVAMCCAGCEWVSSPRDAPQRPGGRGVRMAISAAYDEWYYGHIPTVLAERRAALYRDLVEVTRDLPEPPGEPGSMPGWLARIDRVATLAFDLHKAAVNLEYLRREEGSG